VTTPRPLGSLLVELSGQVLALPPASVRAVLPSSKVAALPRAGRGLLGVVHLQGRFVTLVDLGLALGLRGPGAEGRGPSEASAARCVWLAEPHRWAFRADRVLGFEETTPGDAPSTPWGKAAQSGGRAVWELDVAAAARCLETLMEQD
jgi:chemotaxis signal transduction protein